MDKEKGLGGMCVCEGRVSFFIKRLYIQNITRVDIGGGGKNDYRARVSRPVIEGRHEWSA